MINFKFLRENNPKQDLIDKWRNILFNNISIMSIDSFLPVISRAVGVLHISNDIVPVMDIDLHLPSGLIFYLDYKYDSKPKFKFLRNEF